MTAQKTIFSKLIGYSLLILAASCTIIQDGDISSEAQANNLKLSGITINLNTTAGISTVTILPTIDKTVNLLGLSGQITRYVEMSLPALTGKLKLRSGLNTAAKLYIYYYSDGRPNSYGIFKENLVGGAIHDTTYYEVYRFRYDASLKLNKIITFINPDASFSTATSNDTLFYSNGLINKVTRKNVGDITTETNNNVLSKVIFSSKNIQANGCSTCVNDFYSSFNYALNAGSGSNTSTDMSIRSLFTKLQKITLIDQLINNGSFGGTARLPDTYYLHPTMLFRDQLSVGDQLIFIYMLDWWTQGAATSGTNYTKNDVVDIIFNYVK